MDELRQEPAAETLRLPRSFPAWAGVWIAAMAALPAEALLSVWFGGPTALENSVLIGLLKLLALVVGGAVAGHLAQFTSPGLRLRLCRICVAAVVFDLGLVTAFRFLSRWTL